MWYELYIQVLAVIFATIVVVCLTVAVVVYAVGTCFRIYEEIKRIEGERD